MACAYVQPATVKAHAPCFGQVTNIRLWPSPREDIGATSEPRLTSPDAGGCLMTIENDGADLADGRPPAGYPDMSAAHPAGEIARAEHRIVAYIVTAISGIEIGHVR